MGVRHRLHRIVTCCQCGTACALDDAVAGTGTRSAVKRVPTGNAAIMHPI
jgi:hypothetical protein